MKKDFFTKGMITDIKSGLKNVLEYILITASLGIITGFGTYTTLFGALILTFVFLVFYKNVPLIFSVTITAAASMAFFNVALGGRSSTLFAMLFISSLILAGSAFIKKENLKYLKPPKPISEGFFTACAIICFLLSFPLFLGHKTFSSINLMFGSIYSVFQNCNEFAIAITLLVFACYHYLSNSKIKHMPAMFLSVTAAGIINGMYGAPLDSAASGFQNLRFVVAADFGHFFLLLFCSLLLACIIFVQTNICSDLVGIKSNKRMLFLTGVTGVFGSMSGFVTGSVACAPTKRVTNDGGKSKTVSFVEFAILIIIILFFAKIAPNIPTCALGAALAHECFLIIKKSFIAQKPKLLLVKIVYAVSLILTLINLISGVLFAIGVTIFTNFLHHKKYN